MQRKREGIEVGKSYDDWYHLRRAMQPEIHQRRICPMRDETVIGLWISIDVRDLFRLQQGGRAFREPALVPCFQRNRNVRAFAHQCKKTFCRHRIECEARGQLHQASNRAWSPSCVADSRKVSSSGSQLTRRASVRNGLRDLHGKAKRAGHAVAPACIRFRPMRPVKAGVDLDAGQHLRITGEVSTLAGEVFRDRVRKTPPAQPIRTGPELCLSGGAMVCAAAWVSLAPGKYQLGGLRPV